MSRYNRPDNEWTVALLEISTRDAILEVGFGPGQAVELAARKATEGLIAGVDHSAEMVAAASRPNKIGIASGQIDLRVGTVMELPYRDSLFDKAFSINCIYFWENPVAGLRELHRVLKPQGRLAITVRESERSVYQAFMPEKLSELLKQAGFRSIELHRNGDPSHPLACAIGVNEKDCPTRRSSRPSCLRFATARRRLSLGVEAVE
ncbi:MAG: class I SAM-dependent methyltransferase [Pseudomonadota bacterium]|nr:class I SAM-dependent methyltransferase [Pseudomonadota bacterium]